MRSLVNLLPEISIQLTFENLTDLGVQGMVLAVVHRCICVSVV